ncbi:hypothetical protein [Actinoplanes sp. NPDC026619]|uniref:hypothetical protein n=1 Tax=Actinoplanes sp. NPDC026619 TaxID=3155798 RepID=UPI0033C61096
MTGNAQATFVVEYPCDRFCRIEVDVSRERGQLTLQQMRDKAEKLHQQEHGPEQGEGEAETPVVEQDTSGRPAPTVFLSAPGRTTESAPSRSPESVRGRGSERRR